MQHFANIAATECQAARLVQGVPEWRDRNLPEDYGQHRRGRRQTAAMIQACWYAGYRGTSEIAAMVGVTPSCVSAHKARLGLPKVRYGRGEWKGKA